MRRICIVWLCALLMFSSAFVGMNFENEVGGTNPTVETKASYIITNVWELQNMSLDLAGNYTLANDIDASITSGWNGGAGFVPTGTTGTPFTGTLEGQGYNITGLFINRSSENYVGLFGYIDSGGAVSNVSLINNNVSGHAYVGGFVGWNDGGTITKCYSTGNVTGYIHVGSLAGYSDWGTITNCYSTGNASGTGDYVGDFAGTNHGGTITDCYSTGNASGDSYIGSFAGWNRGSGTITNCSSTGNASGTGYRVGGFAGYSDWGTITNCYSTGDASGDQYVGGFAGYNNGDIKNCYSTGNASGTGALVGGFAGYNDGTITNCYSTGDASGTNGVGGFAGDNDWGTITNCSSTGNASGIGEYVGGFAGYNGGDIKNCYSTGNVTGNTDIGGFAGHNNFGTITNCYSTGNVTGNTDIGGFAGNNTGTIADCFWDTETSGQATSAGGTGKTTAEMTQQATFDPPWDFTNVWGIDEGVTYPYLLSFWEPSQGLAYTPWPMFRQNLNHTGQSPYDTSHVDGTEKWRFTTGDDVFSSPVIGADGTIYVGSEDHNLYAINPNGTEKWNFTTGHFVYSSPAIGADGTIYVGSDDNNLYAINPNGTEKWNFTTGNFVYSSPVIGADGTIYVGSYDNNLYAINPNGTKRWNFTTGSGVFSSPAIGADGTIYVGSKDHNLYAINPNGTERWNFTTGNWVKSSPAIGADGTIYVGSRDHNLYAINPNGTEKWHFTTGDMVEFSSPAIGADGTIYVGSEDHNLYAINPNGTEKWNFITGNWVRSSPAIGADGMIYVGSYDNNLYAINPNGTERWHFTTGNSVFSSPAVGADGTIYVGSRDNNLYAIGSSLAARWPFDEGWGQYTNDTSGYDNDGELMPSYPGNVPGWTNGISGNALEFDGTDDYVEVPDNDALDITDEITIESWVLVRNSKDFNTVLAKGADTTENYEITFYGDQHIHCPIYFNNLGRQALESPASLVTDNIWHHIGMTYRPGQWRIYVDGEMKAERVDVSETIITNDLPLYIGSEYGTGDRYFSGTIDEVSIWSRALNATEINERYTSYLCLADTPWPMFRQNLNHTGLSPYDTSHVDGTEKWNFTTGSYVKSSPAISVDGTIYIGSSDNNLYAISPNGTEKWRFTTGDDVFSSPAIGSDDTIYVGSLDHNLYAINPNGTEKWNFTTGDIIYSSATIGFGGTIYIGSEDNNLYAINLNGTEKWNITMGNDVFSSPAIGVDGTIYVGSYDHNLYAINLNGTEKWNITMGNDVFSSPAIDVNGTIYIGSYDNYLYAINPNGTEKWKFATGGVVYSSPAVDADSTIYVGSSDNNLYAINPNGTEKWKFTTGDVVYSSPAIGADGTIYVGSYDNRIYAINPNGTEKWNFTTGNYVWSSPAIGADGTIYVGSNDNNLYAIGSSLCAYWPFSEGLGQYTNDTSGYDNDGALMPSYPGNVPGWTNGISGNALDFDGSDDYVEVPDDDALDITDEITIEAWVKLSSYVEWGRVLSKANNAVDNCIYILGVSQYDGIYFALWNSGVQTYINGQADIPLNEWTHIVGVWNGSVMKAYLNGVEQPETQPFNGPIDTSTGALRIGKGDNIHQHPFNGTIDEVSIWGRALDATEILQHYQQYHRNYTRNLSLGWNLISLPLIQDNESIDQVLESINGKWDYIQAYNATDPDHWKTNATFKPDQLNNLDSLNHKLGFWINITESGVMLTINGTMPSSTSIPLYAGWNLVGYPSLAEKNISDALAGTGYDRVEGFNATAPYRIIQLADSYMMRPGEGYWIHVPADTTWVIDW